MAFARTNQMDDGQTLAPSLLTAASERATLLQRLFGVQINGKFDQLQTWFTSFE
jgi:hypothetical protein